MRPPRARRQVTAALRSLRLRDFRNFYALTFERRRRGSSCSSATTAPARPPCSRRSTCCHHAQLPHPPARRLLPARRRGLPRRRDRRRDAPPRAHARLRGRCPHRALDGQESAARRAPGGAADPRLDRRGPRAPRRPPAVRRRFLDRALVHRRPGTLETIGRYGRALAAKRALLADGRGRLAAWNELLARDGARLVAARAELIAELSAAVEPAGATPASRCRRPRTRLPADPRTRRSTARRRSRRRSTAPRPQSAGAARRCSARTATRSSSAWPARRPPGRLGRREQGARPPAPRRPRRARGAAGRPPLLLLDDADTELDRGRLAQLVGASPRAGPRVLQPARGLAGARRPRSGARRGGSPASGDGRKGRPRNKPCIFSDLEVVLQAPALIGFEGSKAGAARSFRAPFRTRGD